MWNPIKDLVDAYMEGRNIQLLEMERQTKILERIAVALEKLAKT